MKTVEFKYSDHSKQKVSFFDARKNNIARNFTYKQGLTFENSLEGRKHLRKIQLELGIH